MSQPRLSTRYSALPLSSRPERSAVEGSAFLSTSNQRRRKRHPALCHPGRSAAQWRDLQFSLPATNAYGSATLPFVIPTEAQRSGGICSLLSQPKNKTGYTGPSNAD
jgi:hypothetical protein